MIQRFALLALCIAGAASIAACSSSDKPPPTLTLLKQPQVLKINTAPLAKRLTVATNLNADFAAEIESDRGESFTIFFNPRREFNTEGRVDYDLTLLGLRPSREYTLTLTAETADGLTATAGSPVVFTTPPLPADFPQFENMVEPDTDAMEPGYTLLDARRKDGTSAYIVVLDAEGEVTWYYRPAGTSSTRLSVPLVNPVDGSSSTNLLTVDETIGLIQELTWRGETARRVDIRTGDEVEAAFYSAASDSPVGDALPVDVASFHDDAFRSSATTTYFSSVKNIGTIQNYPLDEFDQSDVGPADVTDEPIVEFDLDGEIVEAADITQGRWDLLDILKRTRIGYDGTDGLPDGPADWVHVNAVVLDTSNNSLLVSLRHQDAIVAISRSSGELLWILGTPDNWEGFEEFLFTPDPDDTDFAWPYHQHSHQISASRRLLMFDNGNRRASPFTGDPIVEADVNQSRAVEYELNLTDSTVSQVWEWDPLVEIGEPLYSTTAGDADRQPTTGNTLITFGALCEIGGVASDDLDNCRTTARIIEVSTETDADTGEQTNTVVSDMRVDSEPGGPGYIVWRTNRISTLYTNESAVIVPAE